jgi:hypothetical protein
MYPCQRDAYINIGHGRLDNITINSIQFTFSHSFALVFFPFCFSSIRYTSRRPNSLSCHGSCLSIVQTSHRWRRRFFSKLGAPFMETTLVPPKHEK